MLRRWKDADQVTLLMWASKIKVPSRMTPRLFTWGDGGQYYQYFTVLRLQKVQLCINIEFYHKMKGPSLSMLWTLE